MTRRALVGLALAACAVVGTACGVPTSTTPTALDRSQIPNAILSYRPITATTAIPSGEQIFNVYFWFSGTLVAAPRFYKVTKSHPTVTPQYVLAVLEAGPAGSDNDADYSLLPTSSEPRYVSFVKGIVRVELTSNEVFDIAALAQIVWTLRAIHGVAGVRFLVGGKPVAVPDGSGNIIRGPVTEGNYENFAPQ